MLMMLVCKSSSPKPEVLDGVQLTRPTFLNLKANREFAKQSRHRHDTYNDLAR